MKQGPNMTARERLVDLHKDFIGTDKGVEDYTDTLDDTTMVADLLDWIISKISDLESHSHTIK